MPSQILSGSVDVRVVIDKLGELLGIWLRQDLPDKLCYETPIHNQPVLLRTRISPVLKDRFPNPQYGYKILTPSMPEVATRPLARCSPI